MKLAHVVKTSLAIFGIVAIALLLLPARSFAGDADGAMGMAGSDTEFLSVENASNNTEQTEPTITTPSSPSNEYQTNYEEETVYINNTSVEQVQDGLMGDAELIDVWYVDELCEQRLAEDCTPITETTTSLKTGWYVLEEDVELPKVLIIEGDVQIIFVGGHTLVAPKGIRVKKDAKLSLYAHDDLSGRLVVQKGVLLQLTEKQKAEAAEALALELERDPNYKEKKPQLLFVWPCLNVVAGDHEPRVDDELDPDHAPKEVDKPRLNESLLKKEYLCIQPRVYHDAEQIGSFFVCETCEGWFADDECHVALEKNEANARELAQMRALGASEVYAESSSKIVTVDFDPNGGTGSMDSLQVEAGKTFELPECTFEPPAGKEFNMWSLGKPGTKVSVPSSTTVKAWWKDAASTSKNNDSADASSDTAGAAESSDTSTGQNTSSQSTSTSQGTTTNSSNKSSTPKMSDSSVMLTDIAGVLLVGGSILVLAGKSHLIDRR